MAPSPLLQAGTLCPTTNTQLTVRTTIEHGGHLPTRSCTYNMHKGQSIKWVKTACTSNKGMKQTQGEGQIR